MMKKMCSCLVLIAASVSLWGSAAVAQEAFKFSNTPVDKVLEEFATYYNTVILLDSDVENFDVTGSFEKKSLEKNINRIFKQNNLITLFDAKKNEVTIRVFGGKSDMRTFSPSKDTSFAEDEDGEDNGVEISPGVKLVPSSSDEGGEPAIAEIEPGVVLGEPTEPIPAEEIEIEPGVPLTQSTDSDTDEEDSTATVEISPGVPLTSSEKSESDSSTVVEISPGVPLTSSE